MNKEGFLKVLEERLSMLEERKGRISFLNMRCVVGMKRQGGMCEQEAIDDLGGGIVLLERLWKLMISILPIKDWEKGTRPEKSEEKPEMPSLNPKNRFLILWNSKRRSRKKGWKKENRKKKDDLTAGSSGQSG